MDINIMDMQLLYYNNINMQFKNNKAFYLIIKNKSV